MGTASVLPGFYRCSAQPLIPWFMCGLRCSIPSPGQRRYTSSLMYSCTYISVYRTQRAPLLAGCAWMVWLGRCRACGPGNVPRRFIGYFVTPGKTTKVDDCTGHLHVRFEPAPHVIGSVMAIVWCTQHPPRGAPSLPTVNTSGILVV